jgi:uncharacterized protein
MDQETNQERLATRGFARMNQEKQREIARKGGANVPNQKRSFSQNRALASDAGRKGGRSVGPQARSFSRNRKLASEAGHKGGLASQRKRRLSQQAPHDQLQREGQQTKNGPTMPLRG